MPNRSASGIVMHDDEVLLVRHTYGMLKGRLLFPGGVVEDNELPMECVAREVLEEAGVICRVGNLICVRFRPESWWVCFLCDYVSGEPEPDGRETDQALFMKPDEAVRESNVTDTVKMILQQLTMNGARGFTDSEYQSPNFTDSRYALFI